MDKLTTVCIWLIKTLCIDMGADKATYTQDLTKDGVHIGNYKITIEKI